MMLLTKVLLSHGPTGRQVDKTPGDMWTQIPGARWIQNQTPWSHSPGRQQPVNQEDHLWHKMGGGDGRRHL